MNNLILAHDLGTGGNKASLYNMSGDCLASVFIEYPTYYPYPGFHEQKPIDWWNAVVESTVKLMSLTMVNKADVVCIAFSGHSLGVVPVDADGCLLRETTPIWSDTRAKKQADDFFSNFSEKKWYLTTGNGFAHHLYSLFKIMWYRDNEPEMFGMINKVIGTKDYINYKLTGKICTDYSYASGSGVYSLEKWGYDSELIDASGLPSELFPQILASTQIIGTLTRESADALGLSTKTKVVAGGVDNSCMALGARNIEEGRIYNSLGSSSWIAISAGKPLLDNELRPFVFTHVIPGMFTSATSIYSAGSSLKWVKENLCANIAKEVEQRGTNVYDALTAIAETSPVGANGLLFNPSMAGGTLLDPSPNIRGAFIGLDLSHNQADVIRATLEGIAMGLDRALSALKNLTSVSDEILLVGGGSSSKLWRQILADAYGMKVVKTNIDQQTATLGAACLGAVGMGLWKDFSMIDEIHEAESVEVPIEKNQKIYNEKKPVYELACKHLSELGNLLHGIDKISK